MTDLSLAEKLDYLARHTRYARDDVMMSEQTELGDGRARKLHNVGQTLKEIQALIELAVQQFQDAG